MYQVKSLSAARARIRADLEIDWKVGDTNQVDDNMIEHYRAHPSVFQITSGPGESLVTAKTNLTGRVTLLKPDGRAMPIAYALGQQHVPVSKTDANTTAAALYSLVIPGGFMGPNDALRINTLWTVPNSATNKKLKVVLGDTEFMNSWQTTIVSFERPVLIRNRNAVNSQIAFNAGQSTGYGNNTGNNVTGAVDMSVNQTLSIIAEWGTAGAGSILITLESVLVELIPAA